MESLVRPLGILSVGALVALALGTYAKLHDPTGQTVLTLGFSGPLQMKVWLTTFAAVLGVAQLLTALRMYGRFGVGRAPEWLPLAHRLTGAGAFVLTLPVGFHCLWSLGFSTFDARTTAHSLLGCAFYGAFVAKVLAVHDRRSPGWLLPVLGATLLTALAALWVSASLWFFTTSGAPAY